MSMKPILSLLMCSFSICSAFQWPIPGITLCHRSHPDFDKCLAENVPKGVAVLRHGLKEIGFPEVDPVKTPPFKLNLTGNRNLEYSIAYTNTYFSGCSYMTMPEINIQCIVKCEKYQKNSKTYIKLTNYTADVNPENVVYYFENIVPGNPEVSAQVLKTLNNDPLLVWNEEKSGLNA
ncbi:unnamed protein product, partial [Callosobruchus maculatus]